MSYELTDFGQLRSWMNLPELDLAQRKQLWMLLNFQARTHKAEYLSSWQPYLESFPHHFVEPLATLKSLDELTQAAELLPFARFVLQLTHYTCRGDEGVKALVRANGLSLLNALDLSQCGITEKGVVALASSTDTGSLTELDLSVNSTGDEGALALAESMHLNALTSLDLSSNDICSPGAIALANSTALNTLTSLNLSSNKIRRAGADALSRSTSLSALTELDLNHNPTNSLEPEGSSATCH